MCPFFRIGIEENELMCDRNTYTEGIEGKQKRGKQQITIGDTRYESQMRNNKQRNCYCSVDQVNKHGEQK